MQANQTEWREKKVLSSLWRTNWAGLAIVKLSPYFYFYRALWCAERDILYKQRIVIRFYKLTENSIKPGNESAAITDKFYGKSSIEKICKRHAFYLFHK